MAKTITVNVNHEYTSGRGEKETVAEALKWLETHSETDEESGEVTMLSPGDLIVYAVRRLRALHKDVTRVGKGKAPSRIYTPRVAEVKDATKNAAERKEEARQALAKALHVDLAKPEPKAAPKAPKGSPARGAQVKAKHEAKQARKAKRTKDEGGASIEL